IERRPAPYHHASFGKVWPKLRSTIRLGKDRIGQITPDLARVDIKGTNHLDISGRIITNFWKWYADGFPANGFAISKPFDQSTRAIANCDHGDSDQLPKVARDLRCGRRTESTACRARKNVPTSSSAKYPLSSRLYRLHRLRTYGRKLGFLCCSCGLYYARL